MRGSLDVRDLGDYVNKLSERIRRLEQNSSTAALTALPQNPTFTTVTVDSSLFATASNPATNLMLTTGIFQSEIFIDATWTLSATANEYQVEVAQKISGVYQAPQQFRTGGTNIRIESLLPSTIYGVRVYAINRLGLSSAALPSSGFTDITTAVDTTIPSNITGLTVTAGFKSLIAVWSDSTDFDFDVYQLQLATNSGFTTGVRDVYERGSIGGFTDLSPNTTYWVRVRAYDQSGNVGNFTAGASVTTLQLQSADVPALFIESAMIANAAILTAKIGDLQVTNAKMNDVVIDKVSAGTISSKDYVLGAGGQIKTSSLAPGFVINSQGISVYNSSAVRTIFLDASTGSGTFYGAISSGTVITAPAITGGTIESAILRTAVAGNARFELDYNNATQIRGYTGHANELTPGDMAIGFTGSGVGATPFIQIESPVNRSGANRGSTTAWFGDSNDGTTTRLIKHTSTLHQFIGGNVVVYDGQLKVENSNGIFMGGTGGSSCLSGQFGGAAPGLSDAGGNNIIFFDWTGTALDIYVAGSPDTLVKTFVIPHPTDPLRYLVHAALEGPTADIFYRGTGQLKDGECEVTLPAYFESMARLTGRQVQVTPIWDGKNPVGTLAATDIKDGKFKVGLAGGSIIKNQKFNWLIIAVRKDVAELEVEPLKIKTVVKGTGPYTYIAA